MIARRSTAIVGEWAQTWWSHIQRYSRRDQLSLLVALRISGIKLNRLDLDNYNSEFHQWPVISNRKNEARISDVPNYRGIATDLKEEVHVLHDQIATLEKTVDEIRSSTSWRLTRSFRSLSGAVKRLMKTE
jgi:hypothetical protein